MSYTSSAISRTYSEQAYHGLVNLWANKTFRYSVIAMVAVALFMLSGAALADDAPQVGLSRWQKSTLEPQAKSAWFIIKIIAIVMGLIFMVVGFVKLTGQQKSGAWPMILVGGLLASVTTFVVLTGETVSGQQLEKDANTVLGIP